MFYWAVCKFNVYGLILSITFNTEGGFMEKSQKSVAREVKVAEHSFPVYRC